ncbi:MAG: 3-dehydroquinate synthase [Gemmatales bacterium]|nr:3-dehydroquinate synthase [Gemmatales bacterium]MDW8387244.1 3-dehydroquinate synthase [Gemmatales bacterium]
MASEIVSVRLGERSYPIRVGSGSGEALAEFVRQCSRSSRAFIVTDDHVAVHARHIADALTAGGLDSKSYCLPPGESQKTLDNAARLYDFLAEHQADRRSLIVAVGGGVIGDLAGFVAATFARGLPLFMVPTSLLAMVDSSVGGKTGVNHPKAKNLIGAFHQPCGVWIDTDLLATLPEREYRSGLAEVVKYGVILDAELFAYLERNVEPMLARQPDVLRHVIARCCRLKADIVEQDERETTGLRAVLNYGHTFAHAFETVGGYGAWLHGEAVSAGMVCAATLAERLGLVSSDVGQRQERLLRRFGLPVRPQPWPVEDLLRVMHSDKKAVAGRLRFVLPRRIGHVELIENVSEAAVRGILHSLMADTEPVAKP